MPKNALGFALGTLIISGIACVVHAQIPSTPETPPAPSNPVIQGATQPLDNVSIGQKSPGLGSFASPAAGVGLTVTNAGASAKELYFYTGSQYLDITDATGGLGDGFYIDATNNLVGFRIDGTILLTDQASSSSAIPVYLYSNSQFIGLTDSSALSGNGIFIDHTNSLLRFQISTTNVGEVTSTGLNAMDIGTTTVGKAAFSTISATGQITSTVAGGTAPLVIASSTNVPNLNASSLNGATFASPGDIGTGSPGNGNFTGITGNNGSAGHATCWNGTTISYCTTVVSATGTCTCH